MWKQGTWCRLFRATTSAVSSRRRRHPRPTPPPPPLLTRRRTSTNRMHTVWRIRDKASTASRTGLRSCLRQVRQRSLLLVIQAAKPCGTISSWCRTTALWLSSSPPLLRLTRFRFALNDSSNIYLPCCYKYCRLAREFVVLLSIVRLSLHRLVDLLLRSFDASLLTVTVFIVALCPLVPPRCILIYKKKKASALWQATRITSVLITNVYEKKDYFFPSVFSNSS